MAEPRDHTWTPEQVAEFAGQFDWSSVDPIDARIARIEAAPAAPESAHVVEKVARAIGEADRGHGPSWFPCRCGWDAGFGVGWESRGLEHKRREMALAAVVALDEVTR